MGETRKHRGGVYGNVTLSRWDFKLVRPIDITIRDASNAAPCGPISACGASLPARVQRASGDGAPRARQQAIRLMDRDLLRAIDISGPAHRAGRFQRMDARTGDANAAGRISLQRSARAPHTSAQLSRSPALCCIWITSISTITSSWKAGFQRAASRCSLRIICRWWRNSAWPTKRGGAILGSPGRFMGRVLP